MVIHFLCCYNTKVFDRVFTRTVSDSIHCVIFASLDRCCFLCYICCRRMRKSCLPTLISRRKTVKFFSHHLHLLLISMPETAKMLATEPVSARRVWFKSFKSFRFWAPKSAACSPDKWDWMAAQACHILTRRWRFQVQCRGNIYTATVPKIHHHPALQILFLIPGNNIKEHKQIKETPRKKMQVNTLNYVDTFNQMPLNK